MGKGTSKSGSLSKRMDGFSETEYEIFQNHTSMSKLELELIHKEFYHKSKTGFLNKEQFVAFYLSLKNESYEKMGTLAEKIFNSFDTNGDELVDLREFMVN